MEKTNLHMEKDNLHMEKTNLQMEKDNLHMEKTNLQMEKDNLHVQEKKKHEKKRHSELVSESIHIKIRSLSVVEMTNNEENRLGFDSAQPPHISAQILNLVQHDNDKTNANLHHKRNFFEASVV